MSSDAVTKIHKAFRQTGFLALAASFLIASTAFLLWISQNDELKHIGNLMMKTNTSVAIICASVSIFYLGYANRPRRNYSYALAGIVLFIGAFTLIQFALELRLPFDELITTDEPLTLALQYPNRMSSFAAMQLILIGLAILTHNFRIHQRTYTFQILAVLLIALSIFTIVGRLFDVTYMFAMGPRTGISYYTSFAHLFLTVALLCIHPDRGFMKTITSPLSGGMLMRRLLLPVVLLSLLLGWLNELGQAESYFGPNEGSSLSVLTYIYLFGFLIYYNAKLLNRATADNARLLTNEQNALKLRDEFLSVASHELRTPLTTLKLHAQIERKSLENNSTMLVTADHFKYVIDSCEKQVDRITRLIDDMLDISRFSSKKLALHIEPTNLVELTQQVIERLNPHITDSKCFVSFTFEKNVMCNCDRFRIEQVVINLITNAIKYGCLSTIKVHVFSDSGFSCIQVKDSGIGISTENIEKIFNRFERVGNTRNYAGLGLGLYIAKNIVDLHKGLINVESEEGKGTTFTVKLPSASN